MAEVSWFVYRGHHNGKHIGASHPLILLFPPGVNGWCSGRCVDFGRWPRFGKVVYKQSAISTVLVIPWDLAEAYHARRDEMCRVDGRALVDVLHQADRWLMGLLHKTCLRAVSDIPFLNFFTYFAT